MYAMNYAEALPTTIRIRPASAGDIPAIARMHSANYGRSRLRRASRSRPTSRRRWPTLYETPGGGRLWVAEREDGTVVGSIGITRESETEARLRWYIMRDEARGTGVGRRLIEKRDRVRARAGLRAGLAVDRRRPRGVGAPLPQRRLRARRRVGRADLGRARARAALRADVDRCLIEWAAMTAVLLALGTALCYGVSNFVGPQISRSAADDGGARRRSAGRALGERGRGDRTASEIAAGRAHRRRPPRRCRQRGRPRLLLPGGEDRAAVDHHADRLAGRRAAGADRRRQRRGDRGGRASSAWSLAIGGVALASRRAGRTAEQAATTTSAARCCSSLASAVGVRDVSLGDRAGVRGRRLLGRAAEPHQPRDRAGRRRARFGPRAAGARRRPAARRAARRAAVLRDDALRRGHAEGLLSVVSVVGVALPGGDDHARVRVPARAVVAPAVGGRERGARRRAPAVGDVGVVRRTSRGATPVTAPLRNSAIAFDSCAPCHAIGDLPSSSTSSSRVRQPLRVGLGDRQRVARVGLVAEPTTSVGTSTASSASSPSNARARHHPQRARHRVRVAVALESLPRERHHGLAERRSTGGLVGGQEAVDAARVEPVGEPVPVVEVGAGALAVVGRRDLDEARRPARGGAIAKRIAVAAPIEWPARTARSMP